MTHTSQAIDERSRPFCRTVAVLCAPWHTTGQSAVTLAPLKEAAE